MRVAVGQRALDLLELRPRRSRQRPNVLEHRRAIGIHRHPIRLSRPARRRPHGPRALSFSAVRPKFVRRIAAHARRCAPPAGSGDRVAARPAPRGARRLRRPRHRGARGRPRDREGGLRAQRELGPPPRLEREARRHLRRARRPRPVVPDAHRGARRRPAQGRRRLGRRPRPQGLRRPLPRRRRPRRARPRPARERDPARDRPAARRRVVLRLAARRAWVEAVVRHRRVAAALGARPGRARAATAKAFRRALRRAGVRVHGRHEARARRRLAARRPLLAAARGDPPPHGRRERQLPGRDGAEEPRRGRRAAGHDRRGRLGRPRDPGRAEDPARRRPDRRRLRPVLARPPDPEGARDDPAAGAGPTATCARSLLRRPAGRGPRRDAAGPDAQPAGARQRPREDGHARQRVGALGLRPRPLRVLDPRQRAGTLVLRRTGRAGPVRDGARGASATP